MPVRIDTVYQRVLAIANKEQRGYITPQEFNLYANLAQMDIFEQYFYDLNQFRRINGNDTVYSDMVTKLEDKIEVFERLIDTTGILSPATSWAVAGGGEIIVPDDVHSITRVEYSPDAIQPPAIQAERLNTRDFNSVIKTSTPLLNPSPVRPVCNLRRNRLSISDGTGLAAPPANNINIFYIRRPIDVNWGYVVIRQGGGKALYNANTAIDFELHISEEVELVYKILTYAGIAIKREDIVQGGASLDASKKQQEKQ
jgi:hypothetical protein